MLALEFFDSHTTCGGEISLWTPSLVTLEYNIKQMYYQFTILE